MRVRVADGVDVVGAALVDGRVDEVAGGVGGARRVPTGDPPRRDLQADHVAGREHAEVASERVHPHQARVLRVPHRDVPRLALGEPVPRPVPERRRHVHEGVPPVLRVGREGRDTWVW